MKTGVNPSATAAANRGTKSRPRSASGGTAQRDRHRNEQGHVQPRRVAEPHPSRDLDRQVHRDEDAREDERVHEPRRAEQEREPNHVGRLEQEERRSHEEQVDIGAHLSERAGGHAYGEERSEHDREQGDEVERRDPVPDEIRERVVVRDRRGQRRRALPSAVTHEILGPHARGQDGPAPRTDTLAELEARWVAERPGQSVRVAVHHHRQVVVVHRDHSPGLQVLVDLLHRFAGEQVALQPQRRLTGEDRERIGDRVQDEVVSALGVVEERPTVLDVHRHARVLIRVVGVMVATESIQQRVDLHGVDVCRALRERDRHVVAAAGADDQHVRERVLRRVLVGLEAMGLRLLHHGERHDPLVRPAVHPDPDAVVRRRCERGHAVVRRPLRVRREGQDAEDDDRDAERHDLCQPGPRTHRQVDHRRDRAPHERGTRGGRTARRTPRCPRCSPRCPTGTPRAVRTGRRAGPPPRRWRPSAGRRGGTRCRARATWGAPAIRTRRRTAGAPRRARPGPGRPRGTGRTPPAAKGRDGRDRRPHAPGGTRRRHPGSSRAARSS